MKYAFVFINLFTIATFAKSVSLECIPTSPCLYATTGLDVCVTKISVYASTAGFGTEVIQVRPVKPEHEVLLKSRAYKIETENIKRSFRFQDESGDQFGTLTARVGGGYKGTITVDQDFEFQVKCVYKILPQQTIF